MDETDDETRFEADPAYRVGRQEHAFNRPQVTTRDVGGLELVHVSVGGPAGLRCPWYSGEGPSTRVCQRAAGLGTAHAGAGFCDTHGGNGKRKNREGAWEMAHAYAAAMNTTPWQALLEQVKRLAGGMAYLDTKVAEAPDDDALLAGGSHHEYVVWRQREGQELARTAKMALDAGVAERLVAQAEYEGSEVAGVMLRTLAHLSSLGMLTEAGMAAARGALRRELLALESGVVDGEVVESHDNVVKGPWK